MKIKNLIAIITFCIVLISCSYPKRLAYDFVKKSRNASVAFYVPAELKKENIRKDCNPRNIDLIVLDEEQLRDTIEARTKIVNKIDDDIFLDVMYASFEETLKDYKLKLEYWENENARPDSMHWIVDMSYVEVHELVEHLLTNCGVEGNYEFIPSTTVNVASWFELANDENSHLLFTEQNYCEYIIDCNYSLDTANNLLINADVHRLSIDGFYDFAVVLGRLYAGYAYDFFMNDYVRKEMIKKGKTYNENMYMRYDPYELFIYSTNKDKLIKMEE